MTRLTRAVFAVLVAVPLFVFGLHGARTARAAPPPPVVQRIFDSGAGIAPGWMDFGWSPHQLHRGEPASVDLAGYGGWILARQNTSGEYGGLTFRFKAPPGYGDFLAVRLDTPSEHGPETTITEANSRPVGSGFREVFLPMEELNPSQARFDRVVLRAAKPVEHEPVLFDEIGLTGEGKPPPDPYAAAQGPSRTVRLAVDCKAKSHAISPLIYGVGSGYPGAGKLPYLKALGAGARRWGGNPTSRYNWKLGNAWNTASDWFFRNTDYDVKPGPAWATFLDEDAELKIGTALTVPTLGWVAKDTKSAAFPVSAFGPQQQLNPYDPKYGNGVSPSGKPIQPGAPQRTSVESTPASVGEWVARIKARSPNGVQMYILDNEPSLWNSTHRDVHPEPATYDELLEKMASYGAAVRKADPGAVIAGPAEWGWTNYFFSAADTKAGTWLRPDRLRHGNKPLLPWLLQRLRAREKETKVRLLDVVDVHHYPQWKGVGIKESGDVGPEAAARRIRSTRALWDPAYKDESWIDEEVRLIPRLREWIEENAPGLGVSIGEWNFGAENHQSGGLAVAEVLGRFGTEGITSAFYWDYPADQSAAYWAFRAYRNYDGRGGKFLDHSVPATGLDERTSLFASRDETSNHLVLVLLNLDPSSEAQTTVDLGSCGRVETARVFGYPGGRKGLREVPAPPRTADGTLKLRAPKYSITVIELKMAAAGGR